MISFQCCSEDVHKSRLCGYRRFFFFLALLHFFMRQPGCVSSYFKSYSLVSVQKKKVSFIISLEANLFVADVASLFWTTVSCLQLTFVCVCSVFTHSRWLICAFVRVSASFSSLKWQEMKNNAASESHVPSPSVSVQVVRHVGPPLHVTAAARTTKVTAKARVAPPLMSSPPPALKANQRPGLHRERSSVDQSAASRTTPTSKLWTGPWKRAQLLCFSSQNTVARATWCAR